MDVAENDNDNEFNIKDYINANVNGVILPQSNPNSIDDATYFEEDDGLDYDINGIFNSVNQDNINDFYFYINQLLSKKSNQKSN